MAWKRGVENNLPGVIRKGHIKEFLLQNHREVSVSGSLKILEAEKLVAGGALWVDPHCAMAYVCEGLPEQFKAFVSSENTLYLHAHEYPTSVLTATTHAGVPVGCIVLNQVQRINSRVCAGELQSWSVFTGDVAMYDCREGAMGDHVRRAATHPPPVARRLLLEIRPFNLPITGGTGGSSGSGGSGGSNQTQTQAQGQGLPLCLSGAELAATFALSLRHCIVTAGEIYTVRVGAEGSGGGVGGVGGLEVVGRLLELQPEADAEEEEEGDGGDGERDIGGGSKGDTEGKGGGGKGASDDDLVLPDHYRAVVDSKSQFMLTLDPHMPAPWTALFHTPSLPPLPSLPSLPGLLDVVNVRCSDGEVFPVRRKLLRPCIALTSLVQAGRGKYALGTGGTAGALGTLRTAGITGVVDAGTGIETGTGTGIETGTGTGTGTGTEPETEMDADADAEGNSASIDVHSCTFDRVLLYLEHAARQEAFQFDPLLAPELLTAAVTLGVSGLQQGCERVLGSFQERVRRSPIRLSEVLARNKAGVGGGGGAGMVKGGSSGSGGGVRGETLLLMSGMVLDITRWLPEHPGGSSIIPEQALDVDCTVFFEIYHASRQSFLYLKEFYIGELALEDRLLVPLPRQEQTQASEAFLANLKRVTPWRLDITAMAAFETHKSF